MNKKSMTARVSAFARAYHYKHNEVCVFSDSIAGPMLGDKIYNDIASNMAKGISFFNPNSDLDEEEALEWIVTQYLSPSPLGRSAFTETALQNSVMIGAKQYLMLGAGYDSFAYRQPDYAKAINIYEVDHPLTLENKLHCLKSNDIDVADNVFHIPIDLTDSHWPELLIRNSNFSGSKITFCSLLGLTYYLSEDDFDHLLKTLSKLLAHGSTLVFDYPDEFTFTESAGIRTKKQLMLAAASGEPMKSSYSYDAMEKRLADNGFLVYNHLNPVAITDLHFVAYNQANPNKPMTAFDNVNYCLAVKNAD